jgi:hypothetical protein
MSAIHSQESVISFAESLANSSGGRTRVSFGSVDALANGTQDYGPMKNATQDVGTVDYEAMRNGTQDAWSPMKNGKICTGEESPIA